jgi:hypothetical protein
MDEDGAPEIDGHRHGNRICRCGKFGTSIDAKIADRWG